MPFALDQQSVVDLISFIDQHVRTDGCDHSHRFTQEWARTHAVNWDDLLDALEQHGAFCDCEVVFNLEDAPLACEKQALPVDEDNRWLLPPKFSPSLSATSKIIVSRAGVGRNNYTHEGEWLVPAPLDARPRKRIRKSVHFFIGIESGLPTEIGFVAEIEPMPIGRFAERIRGSKAPELAQFDKMVAAFVCQKIAKLPGGTAVAANIAKRVGIASKHNELSIHRVFLR